MMQTRIMDIIREACERVQSAGTIPPDKVFEPIIEIPREEEFGDYSTNIAFILAPLARKRPQDIASVLIEQMRFDDTCDRVEVAGKGFINFYIKESEWRRCLSDLCRSGIENLYPDVGNGKRVLIEFVSANPTGPLHIGHGRGAAVGDVLANLLKVTGHRVTKEYYVNDAGRQIQTLGASTYLRWKELQGESIDYPKDYYQGDYVKELATLLLAKEEKVPDDKEEALRLMADFAANMVMDGIVEDLGRFGVTFDNFYRETSLYDRGLVDATLSELREKDYAYEKDDALWFRTSVFEKDEDRVLVKSGGEKTYFASDIAYHRDKFDRGFDLLIDLWGSDHHGYIPRLKASIKALGRKPESLKVILIQFVTLLKEGKPVGMSTRAGEFTTLYDVLKEVGKDAARFFFLMRKSDAHLEFDLDLAKKTSNENPVHYVQYAHARIESIFRNAREEGITLEELKSADTDLLTLKEETNLTKAIFHFTDVLKGSAKSLEPHRVAFYLIDLVAKFHNYYNKARILGNEKDLTVARLALLHILRGVIRTGLDILGVSAPERM